MREFTLNFADCASLELIEVRFQHPLIAEPLISVRGRTAGAFRGFNSFPWTRAVKALSLLFLKAATIANRELSSLEDECLMGGTASLASSLDYAMDKQPLWLADMFGIDGEGRLLVKRILSRTNPNRKRPGPVVITLNNSFLPASGIKVIKNGSAVSNYAELRRMSRVLEGNESEKDGEIRWYQFALAAS